MSFLFENSPFSQLTILFAAGFFVEIWSLFNWRPSFDQVMELIMVGLGVSFLILLLYFFGKIEVNDFAFFFFFLYAIFLPVVFMEKFVFRLDRLLVVMWLICFPFFFLRALGAANDEVLIAVFFGLLLSLPLFLKKKFGPVAEIFYYVITTTCLLTLALVQFFAKGWQDPALLPFLAFMTGLYFAQILPRTYLLLLLIPIPAKRQSFKEKEIELKKHVHLIRKYFDERPIPFFDFCIHLAILASLLILQAFHPFLNDFLLLNLILIVLPLLKSFYNRGSLTS